MSARAYVYLAGYCLYRTAIGSIEYSILYYHISRHIYYYYVRHRSKRNNG